MYFGSTPYNRFAPTGEFQTFNQQKGWVRAHGHAAIYERVYATVWRIMRRIPGPVRLNDQQIEAYAHKVARANLNALRSKATRPHTRRSRRERTRFC